MKKHPIKTNAVNNESEQHSGFIVGSGSKSGNVSVKAANEHNGMVMGGSVTSKRETASEQSLNRLASNRSDGRIV